MNREIKELIKILNERKGGYFEKRNYTQYHSFQDGVYHGRVEEIEYLIRKLRMLNSEQNPERSVARDADSKENAGPKPNAGDKSKS